MLAFNLSVPKLGLRRGLPLRIAGLLYGQGLARISSGCSHGCSHWCGSGGWNRRTDPPREDLSTVHLERWRGEVWEDVAGAIRWS